MPELNLAQTVCFAAMLLLSLVLPLMASTSSNQKIIREKLKIVWLGQALISIAALAILFFPKGYLYAIGFAVVSCIGCARSLRRIEI
jgi:hypothetical protein